MFFAILASPHDRRGIMKMYNFFIFIFVSRDLLLCVCRIYSYPSKVVIVSSKTTAPLPPYRRRLLSIYIYNMMVLGNWMYDDRQLLTFEPRKNNFRKNKLFYSKVHNICTYLHVFTYYLCLDMHYNIYSFDCLLFY